MESSNESFFYDYNYLLVNILYFYYKGRNMMLPIHVPVWIAIAEMIRHEILLQPSGIILDIQTDVDEVISMPPETLDGDLSYGALLPHQRRLETRPSECSSQLS